MTPDDLTPEEFSRLMALPEDHPERLRASRSPAFEARARLHERFVNPDPQGLASPELRSAERELRERLSNVVREGARMPVSPTPSVPRDAHARTGSWLERSQASLRARGARFAWGAAALAVMVGGGIWLMDRTSADHPVRGAAEVQQLVLEAPRVTPGGVDLSWQSALPADSYRVIFYGRDLNEIARLDGLKQMRYELRWNSMPARLMRGSNVLVEVVALKAGDPIGKSSPRTIRIP